MNQHNVTYKNAAQYLHLHLNMHVVSILTYSECFVTVSGFTSGSEAKHGGELLLWSVLTG